MRSLVEAQLPPALARHLASRGHAVDHVVDHGFGSASDDMIWRHAEALEAASITKDEDFAHRKILKDSGPTVIWIRLRNTRRRELMPWFDQALPNILDARAVKR